MKSLRSNFSWTLAGNLVYGGCQWGMMVAVARVGTPAMVGAYAYAQALTAPVILFSNLQLRSIQATDSAERYSFGHYLALRILTTIAAFALILGLAAVPGHSKEVVMVTLLVGLAKSVESMSDVYFGFLQHHELMSRIAKSMMIKGPLSLAAITATVYFTHSIVAGAAAVLCAWTLVYLLYDSGSTRLTPHVSGRPQWSWVQLRELAVLSFPLGITMLLISFNANLPRYFLEHFQGEKSLGLFSVLATLQTAGSLVVMALGNSAAPRLAKYYDEGNWEQFRKLILQLTALCSGLGLAALAAAAIAGDTLVGLVFGKIYAGQNTTLLWIAAGAAVSFASSIFGYAATASRRIAFQPKVCAVAAIITAAGCYLLVPRYGGTGAAVATFVATLVSLILYYWSFVSSAAECRRNSMNRRAVETEAV